MNRSGAEGDSEEDSAANHDRLALAVPPPDAPRLDPKLPAHPEKKQAVHEDLSGYSKAAMATSAGSAFLTPILTLCVGGYLLDQKLHHETAWLSMLGVIVGLALGITSMLRILNRLSK